MRRSVAVAVLGLGLAAWRPAPAQPPVAPEAPSDPRGELGALQEAWRSAAGAVLPSLVKVRAVAGRTQTRGTGFFVRADGVIVTNYRVANAGSRIEVLLPDGRRLPARYVLGDPGYDMTVLQVEGSGFPAVTLDPAADPRPGDWVAVVGNPYDHWGSVTLGMVNAVDRLSGPGAYGQEAVVMDAAINPGVEGGAVVDARGVVVGIAGQLQFDARTRDEIHFAIPARAWHERIWAAIDGGPRAGEGPAPAAAAAAAARTREAALRVAPSLVRIYPSWKEARWGLVDPIPGPYTGIVVGPGEVVAWAPAMKAEGITGFEVELADGTRLPAERRGVDERRDLVLLACDPARGTWTVPATADAAALRPGQGALAWSATFGPAGTASPFLGIVSGLRRQQNAVQTDAPFLHANAGGPMTDADGNVVGVFTQLFGQMTQAGVAFTIPWADVQATLPMLREGRDLAIPFLGAGFAPSGLAQRGVLLTRVVPHSPADEAGLETADLILSCDGAPIRNETQLGKLIQEHLPGDRVVLEVEKGRSGERVRLEVVLRARPAR